LKHQINMNLYKKFTNYLLTHQPLLWHSMSIQLTTVVVLLNLLFYGFGFLHVNLDVIQHSWNIRSIFFDSTYSLFWIIIGLIILIIWGAFFYRHNAAKNFYPISRWYFHKLAGLLFIPALIYFLVPFSFFRGVAHKTQRIIPKSELAEMQRLYDYSKPFLIQYTNSYKYNYRSYPEIYKSVSHWKKGDAYNDHDYDIYEDEEYYYPPENDRYFDVEQYLKNANAEPIEDDVYAYREIYEQDYTIKKGDTCWHSTRKFLYPYNKDSLPDFELYHVKNHFNQKFHRSSFKDFMSDYYLEDVPDESITATCHDWIDNKPEKILETLQDFKAILDRHKIYNSLKPEENYTYLLANDFTVHRSVTGSAYRYSNSYSEDYTSDDLETGTEKLRDFKQALAENELDKLIENAQIAHLAPYFYDTYLKYAFRFLALAGVLLLLYFEWGSVLAFVISIPVAGTFAIFGTLLFAISPHSPSYAIFIIIIIGLFFLIMAFLGLKGSLKPMVGNIAITLSYFMFPTWVLIILGYIQVAFSYTKWAPCTGYGDTEYPFEFNAEPVTSILLYAPFVLFFISLFAIKKIIAKKE